MSSPAKDNSLVLSPGTSFTTVSVWLTMVFGLHYIQIQRPAKTTANAGFLRGIVLSTNSYLHLRETYTYIQQ